MVVYKENRLARREDFGKVYRGGKSVANHQFVLHYLPRPGQEQFRLGVSVSKKIGNAVVRNRLRRMMKEIVRLRKDQIVPQMDFILIARKPVADMAYADLDKSIVHVMKRAELLKRKPAPGGGARPKPG